MVATTLSSEHTRPMDLGYYGPKGGEKGGEPEWRVMPNTVHVANAIRILRSGNGD